MCILIIKYNLCINHNNINNIKHKYTYLCVISFYKE